MLQDINIVLYLYFREGVDERWDVMRQDEGGVGELRCGQQEEWRTGWREEEGEGDN